MNAREAEQKVRERYPDAVCRKVGRWFGYVVFAASARHVLGKVRLGCQRDTEADAWLSAASHLTGE